MPLFSEPIYHKMLQALLANAYTVMPVGFFDGKAGIALTLFEVASVTADERIENHAFHLLQEALAHQTPCNNFNYGKAGIAFVLDYLIGNNLLKADYTDLYQTEQDRIVNEIQELAYNKENGFLYIDYFFFVHALSHRLPDSCLSMCRTILSDHLKTFYSDDFSAGESRLFYFSASKFFSVCNAVNVPFSDRTAIAGLIKEKEKYMEKHDAICEDALYSVKKKIYEEAHRNEKQHSAGRPGCGNLVKDVIVPCLNIKEKVSLVYDLYRLYFANRQIDYRPFADKIKQSMAADDETEQERLLMAGLPMRSEQTLGVGTGLSRLLLLHLYADRIEQGAFPEKLTRLLA